MYSRKTIERILKLVSKRRLSASAAFRRLRLLPYESFSFAKIDHHRVIRKGFPEVVYAPGKKPENLIKIARALSRDGVPLLITRLDPAKFRQLKKHVRKLRYSEEARIAYRRPKRRVRRGCVAIVTGGTSDMPVAEEAAVTLEVLGRKVERIYDCGVAGLHRLIDHLPEMERADVIIAVAGMEGALPSVLAGLVSKPVIAVPTSVGYGANFEGLAALLTMLNACAQGIAVVNIDSGFNAACFCNLLVYNRLK